MSPEAKSYRLKGRRRIGELFAHGVRVSDGRAMLLGLPNDLPHVRMAFAVGRGHGKAVQRNRVTRQCREAFRQVRDDLPAGWDLAVVPHVRAEQNVEELAASLLALARRLVERYGKRNNESV